MAPIRGLIMLLAEKYPNAVNSKAFKKKLCNNVFDVIIDGPSSQGCIVGQAARMSNHPQLLERLYTEGGEYCYPVQGASFRVGQCNAERLLSGCVDRKDIQFAQMVQNYQDRGWKWSECVREAVARGY